MLNTLFIALAKAVEQRVDDMDVQNLAETAWEVAKTSLPNA